MEPKNPDGPDSPDVQPNNSGQVDLSGPPLESPPLSSQSGQRPAPRFKAVVMRPLRHPWRRFFLVVLLLALAGGGYYAWTLMDQSKVETPPSRQDQSGRTAAPPPSPVTLETPKFKSEVLVQGRQNVWDMAFLPDGKMLFTERRGVLNVFDAGTVREVAVFSDVDAKGEGGLLGLAVDPLFAKNRQIYTCLNTKAGDIRVVGWTLSDDITALKDGRNIITGITANPTGRHSGCRLAFGPDGYLWVGTGDSASSDQPQQPKSLNGKILRVTREGDAVGGNLGGNFDSRVYSYGHRNIQGIAFFKKTKNGVFGLSAEHGSSIDDEVNPLQKGNFGWAPSAGYDETGLSMTDTKRFPDAVPAIWSSGTPTQAPSGMAIVNGSKWKGWDGAAAVAMLRAKHLKILRLDEKNKVTQEEKILVEEYGRLRAVVQGPDGSLYISTDNNTDDKIIRLTPQ